MAQRNPDQDLLRKPPNDCPGAQNEAATDSRPKVNYIPYPKAMNLLAARLKATPDELAAWIWMGPKEGGLAAYLSANELDPPPRFFYESFGGGNCDYLSPLMACWFRKDDVMQFEPADRYITGKALIERWSVYPGVKAAAFIRAKIAESRLLDMHPIFGVTQGSFPDEKYLPALEHALFALVHIEAVESEDFEAETTAERDSGPEPDRSAHVQPEHVETRHPCKVFLAMDNLNASELRIAFIGEKDEAGLAANNMLEITARNTTRRIPLASLDLVDRRKGVLNSQAAILLGMAYKRSPPRNERNSKKMTRLREVFSKYFGIEADPFHPYSESSGWEPCFQIADKRGVADEGAKREAERRTRSYEELTARASLSVEEREHDHDFEDESDEAGNWLKDNDPRFSA